MPTASSHHIPPTPRAILTMVRRSARARKVISYAYKELDSDDEPAVVPPDSSDDEDFHAADDAEEVVESDPDCSSSAHTDDEDDSYSEGGRRARKSNPKTPRTSTLLPSSSRPRPPGSAPAVHKKHVCTVANGLTGRGRRKKRLLAEGAPINVIRAPDPTVRVTYRPGFHKASGKTDRIMQVYGTDEEAMEKAYLVKNTFVTAPAAPERTRLRVSPFWREGETVEVGTGDGAQRVEELRLDEAEKHMGPEGVPLKALVGPVGKYQRAVFKRFGVFPLRTYAPEKKGCMFNVGGRPLSMEWATNRPDGMSPLNIRAVSESDGYMYKGDQFLAVSLMNQTDISKETNPDPTEDPPAFARRPSKSAIQIWQFPVPNEESPSPTVDPSVVMMLCHEWGPARAMKWCPARLKFADPKVLGYLAAVFGDGIVRVLKVALPKSYDAESCDFCTPPSFIPRGVPLTPSSAFHHPPLFLLTPRGNPHDSQLDIPQRPRCRQRQRHYRLLDPNTWPPQPNSLPHNHRPPNLHNRPNHLLPQLSLPHSNQQHGRLQSNHLPNLAGPRQRPQQPQSNCTCLRRLRGRDPVWRLRGGGNMDKILPCTPLLLQYYDLQAQRRRAVPRVVTRTYLTPIRWHRGRSGVLQPREESLQWQD